MLYVSVINSVYSRRYHFGYHWVSITPWIGWVFPWEYGGGRKPNELPKDTQERYNLRRREIPIDKLLWRTRIWSNVVLSNNWLRQQRMRANCIPQGRELFWSSGGDGKTFYNFRGEKVEKVRQHLRLRCLGWVGWQDWETNHIAEEELCWFGGRETCQQLTDQVGRLANSREGGGGAFPSSLVVLLPLFIQMPRLPARSQLLQAELGGPWSPLWLALSKV